MDKKIVDKKSFAEQVKSRVEERLGADCRVQVEDVCKNNGAVHTGLRISVDKINISPVIYIDSQYQEYEKGRTTVENAVGHVICSYREKSRDAPADMRRFLSYDSVRKGIVYKLVNTERNRELLEDVPHVDLMELSIVFQYLLSQEELGIATILIHNIHMKLWDVTTEELYDAAEENTWRLLPYEIKSVMDVLNEILESESGEGCREQVPDSVPMHVLSNRCRVEGAACMLYPGLLRELADKAESSLYIIPSSIHELLLLPAACEEESGGIRNMIREINDTQVAPEEILSYSLYYYDREEGKIKML